MTDFLEVTIDKFRFRVAADRLYTAEGVWALDLGGRVRLGLTDYQQQLAGDVGFVHLKPAGTRLAARDSLGDVETIKATVELQSPIAGTIAAVNPRLESSPETLNQDPYGEGWLAEIEPEDWAAERGALLDAARYLEVMKAQADEELRR